MQDLALELGGASSHREVRRPAVHARCHHQVVKGLGGLLLLLLEDHSPATLATGRLQLQDEGPELNDVVQLEGLGVELDIGLNLGARREKVAPEVGGVWEVWELVELLGHLQAKVRVVLLPHPPNILGLLEDGAAQPNLREPSSRLQASDARADDGNRLHVVKVAVGRGKHRPGNPVGQGLRLLCTF